MSAAHSNEQAEGSTMLAVVGWGRGGHRVGELKVVLGYTLQGVWLHERSSVPVWSLSEHKARLITQVTLLAIIMTYSCHIK